MRIELPDELVARMNERELLIDLAAGMYAARRLTLGQAAKLANLSQGKLQTELGRRQIPAHYDLDDLAYDLRAADELRPLMIVVSDTSCLSNLLTVGQADLLAKLFGEVIIPPAVDAELRRFHSSVAILLARLETEAGFRLSQSVKAAALAAAGEPPAA